MKIEWTPEAEAKLGKAPDIEIASELGISEQAVFQHRTKLGIKAHNKTKWTPEIDAMLGVKTDSEIARMMDITPSSVAKRRKKFDIQVSKERYTRPAKDKQNLSYKEYQQYRLKMRKNGVNHTKAVKDAVKEFLQLDEEKQRMVMEYIKSLAK